MRRNRIYNFKIQENLMNQVSQAQAAPAKLVIVSRESALAMWQAEFIRDRLRALYQQTEISISGMTTQGDQLLDVTLSKIGGKGLFVKELETALQDGWADIAVHSLKDVPMHLPPGFMIACISKREDARDAFISNLYANLEELPPGSIVGLQACVVEPVTRMFSHLKIESLRGNIADTLTQTGRGQVLCHHPCCCRFEAFRLERSYPCFHFPESSLPAVGQGALYRMPPFTPGFEVLLRPLHDADTAACVKAERALSRALAGNCQVPLGGFAEIIDSKLRLRGFVGSPDGRRMAHAELYGTTDDPEALGNAGASFAHARSRRNSRISGFKISF